MPIGKKFRIYPTREQQKILSQWIGHQRFVYNAKVGEDRYFRKFSRKALSLTGEQVPCDQKYSQFIGEDTAFLREVPSQILRNGAYKWMTAYQRFYKKTAKGRPTIQKKTGRQSVLITKELFALERLDDRTAALRLGTKKHPVGDIEVRAHLDFSTPDSICISVHGGQWHVSFSNEEPAVIPTEAELLVALQHLTGEQLLEVATGFDRNVVIPVQSSQGMAFDYSPEQKRNFEKAIRGKKRWQKRFARRQKGSANQRKAVNRIARYDRKIGAIRNDFAHKTSHAIVEAPGSLLVFEDLKIRNMTASGRGTLEEHGRQVRQKAGLNKAILNSGWGRVKTYTQYKGLRKSKLTIVVPAHHSSQECSRCGFTHQDNRPSQAVFICQACGFVCNADFNASLIIRKRGARAVLNNEVAIKVPKKTSIRRAGTVRTGVSPETPTPVERVSAVAAPKPLRRSRLKQETPTRTAYAV